MEEVLTPTHDANGTLMTDGMQLTYSPSAIINSSPDQIQTLNSLPSPPRENRKMVPNLNFNYGQEQKENNFNHLGHPVRFTKQPSMDKRTHQSSLPPSQASLWTDDREKGAISG